MTKLSDLLRGAADRAPLGDASVSVSRAARRVRAQRGVRAAGNSVAGLGAVAVAVLGIVQPGSAFNAAQRDSLDLAPEAAPAAGEDASKGSMVASDGRWMSWGTCGSFPLQDYGVGGTDALAIAADFDASTPLAGGDTVKVPVTITANQDVSLTSAGPEAVVLWQGMVVATAFDPGSVQTVELASGDASDWVSTANLVDCFAGAPLPASAYELVVSQAFMNAVDEPTPEPSAEPSTEPQPAVTLPTDLGDPTGAGAGDSAEGSSGDATPPPADMTIMPVEPQGWDYRITSDPIAFTVAGDPVDNPFGDYYPQPWTPPAQPDDILTPAVARTMFDAAATSAPWDMAKGSSRWVLPAGYGQVETFAPTAPDQNYFGCSWDGTSGLHFPTRSANLDLLSVSAEVPSRLAVSYGWVVDDNPKVKVSVTNTSKYSIPGFYGEPNRSLYLVKDGRVVAQAYPVNVDPNGGMLLKEMSAVQDANSQDDPATYWGTLAPGATLSGTYLWRDVSPCSRQDGTAMSLASGTYTLLVMQSMSLQQYSDGTGVTGVGTTEPIRRGGETSSSDGSTDAVGVDPILIDPMPPVGGPVQQDWLDLQVWTSLGTVTITTH